MILFPLTIFLSDWKKNLAEKCTIKSFSITQEVVSHFKGPFFWIVMNWEKVFWTNYIFLAAVSRVATGKKLAHSCYYSLMGRAKCKEATEINFHPLSSSYSFSPFFLFVLCLLNKFYVSEKQALHEYSTNPRVLRESAASAEGQM